MKKNSKNLLAIILSVVLVLSMATVVMISAFADDDALLGAAPTDAIAEDVTAEETDAPVAEETDAPAEETTAAPVEETDAPVEETDAPVAEETTAAPDATEEIVYVGIVGDINADGKVNSADGRLALRFCARLQEPDELDKAEADANCDKFVRSSDARLILRYAAKIEEPDMAKNFITAKIAQKTVAEDGYTVIFDGGNANG